MAIVIKYQNILSILVLLNLAVLMCARPLSILDTVSCPDSDQNDLFDRFSLGSIKDGPSPGIGHDVEDKATLGGIKAGPSPGIGHGNALGGIKDAPRHEDGHEFTSAQTLGGIKDGPSPGIGHKFENVESLEEHKNSGPSPGAGH
uniref:uncharacterized protein LOC122590110 n=1 Tax=Erigeron canadensis TaxID=72917 RepID=UPI001CB8A983|nr:uncharacterized protein LOC122590110 [Erigeron canadensis]